MSCSYQVSRPRKNGISSQGTVSFFAKVLNCDQDDFESKAIPTARQKDSANHKTRGTQQQ